MGSLITAIGMSTAFFMTQPTENQLTNFQGISGAHAVGTEDGGPGLPILGWSTVAGDLRVGHFFGLHAIQVAIVLLLIQIYLPAQVKAAFIIAGNLTYLGFVLIVTGQALRAEPFINPSTTTKTQYFSLIIFSILAFLIMNWLSLKRKKNMLTKVSS